MDAETRPILVTGAAGFIGFHVARRLLRDGHRVIGADNLSAYYDVRLKEARVEQLRAFPHFRFEKLDLVDGARLDALFAEAHFERVAHLAAQAGVRYSLENPHQYLASNVTGFLNVLEASQRHGVAHLLFASSSSVYGANRKQPFSEKDPVDHPVSLYAATKKADELMAHTYAHLYGLPVTGLRFFTVYGPWGRPDMAYFLFTRAILEGRPIDVYNEGQMKRDFTYVDDVVEGVVRVLARTPQPDPAWSATAPVPDSSYAPYRIFNIGNHQPVPLLHFIEVLETALGKKAIKNMHPLQPGDVLETYADVGSLKAWIGFEPQTRIEEGLPRFAAWYMDYYGIK